MRRLMSCDACSRKYRSSGADPLSNCERLWPPESGSTRNCSVTLTRPQLINDEGVVTFERSHKRFRRRRRIQQQRNELLLSLARKADDFQFRNRPLGGILRGGNDKIADRAALNLRGAPHDRESLGCNAGFDSGRSAMFLLLHGTPFCFSIMYGIAPYMSTAYSDGVSKMFSRRSFMWIGSAAASARLGPLAK